MYNSYLLPSKKFILTVHTLTATSLKQIESLSHRYLKKWANLSKCAATEILHIPGFTEIPSIAQTYTECQTIAYVSSRNKADPIVNHALDARLQRENKWTTKESTIVNCDRIYTASKTDNDTHTKRTAIDVWNTHLSSLIKQGAYLKIANELENDISWKSVIYDLPRKTIGFLLNSVLDTLPTNSNLALWGKRTCNTCKICGKRETLGHILNNCNQMLQQGRYTWRHDSVLYHILDFTKQIVKLNSQLEICCDIGERSPVTIPPDILVTTDRPDLVVIDRTNHKIWIFELTVPFEC